MDNYKSEWVLATLKRKLVENSRKEDTDEIWYTHEAANVVLGMIAEIEADSVLGTPEMVTDMVSKLPDTIELDLPGGDTEECEDCKIDFTEVQNG